MNLSKSNFAKRASLCLLLVLLSTLAFTRESAAFDITIENSYDNLPGHPATVGVICNNATEEIAGFDFTIMYQSANLAFVAAEPGEFINRCNWQYFSYRYLGEADDFANVPTGLIRIMASAESNSGPGDPDCYLPSTEEALFYLTFKVPPGCPYRCLILPVRFFWSGCDDNSLILRSDESLAISRYVFDYNGEELTDTEHALPGIWGAPNGCLDNTPPAESRLIDYHNGKIQTACSDEICIDVGDLNCDGVAYEAADVVTFIRLFIILSSDPGWPWPEWVYCAIDNSDINADGIKVSVADLVYMVRIIIGDALPYPKPMVSENSIEIDARSTESGTEIYYRSPVDIGAVMLRFDFEGDPERPEPGAGIGPMQMLSNAKGGRLGILIYSEKGNTIPAGENVLVTIPHDASLTLTDADASDGFGRLLDVEMNSRPTRFEVRQNYPNPFNPSTRFSFYLPQTSDWQVEIYNILGQMIRQYSGYDAAGEVSLTWDGRDEKGEPVAGGIYLYRVKARHQAETRKMLLLK